MAKDDSFLRYSLIIEKLRRFRYTFKEINEYLEEQSRMKSCKLTVSKRTFQRDLVDIADLFGIEIGCNKDHQYYIRETGDETLRQRLLETFDVLNYLKHAKKVSPHILTEQRRPQGTEHLSPLLQAISKRVLISFDYRRQWEDEPGPRDVEPLALKEFKGRWYLLAKDKDRVIKTFGLDRMHALAITTTKIKGPAEKDLETLFQHAFGITNPYGQEPEVVELSFDPTQGNYIRSFPLHSSQKVIAETEKEYRIQLRLYITHDFKMELLSYGDMVNVVAPERLREDLRAIYLRAIQNFEKATAIE